MNRMPWWRRSVRPDFLTLKLTDALISTSLDSRCPYTARHEIQTRQLLVAYTEAESEIPIEIARACEDEKSDGSLPPEGECFEWPRIVITVYPKHSGGPLEESSEGEPSSLEDTLENAPKHHPSPFSSKRIIHESDTPHSKFQAPGDKSDNGHRYFYSSFFYTKILITFSLFFFNSFFIVIMLFLDLFIFDISLID